MKQVLKTVTISLITILVFVLSSCSSTEKNAGLPLEITKIKLNEPKRLSVWDGRGFSVDEDGIFVLVGKDIKFIDNDTKTVKDIANIDVEYNYNVEKAFSRNNDKLYYMTNNSDNTYRINHTPPPDELHLVETDLEGKVLQIHNMQLLLDEYNKNELISIAGLEVIGDKAFILSMVGSTFERNGLLSEYDLNKKTLKVLDMKNIGYIESAQNQLTLYDFEPSSMVLTKIHLYDTESSEIKETIEIEHLSPITVTYSTEHNFLFFASGARDVNLLNMSTNELTKEYMYSSNNEQFLEFIVRGNSLYALTSAGNILIFDNIDGNWQTQKSLNVYSHTPMTYFNSFAMQELADKYPDFQVRITSPNEQISYEEDLAKKLLANDTDFDLYITEPNTMKVIAEKSYVNLSEYEDIANKFDGMLPGLKEIFSNDGELFGVPMDINMTNFTYHKNDFEKYNIAIPKDGIITIDEYLGLYENANEKYFDDRQGAGMVTPLFVFEVLTNNFIAGADIKVEDIEKLLNTMVSAVEKNAISIDYDMIEDGLLDYSSYMKFDSHADVLMVPLYNEDAKYPIEISAACINPYSKNKDLAAELLSAHISKENEEKSVNILKERFFQDMVNVLDDEKFFMLSLDEKIDLLTNEEIAEMMFLAEEKASYPYFYKSETLKDLEKYKIYERVLEKGICINNIGDGIDYSSGQLRNIIEGKTEVSVAANNIYKKLKMIKGE